MQNVDIFYGHLEYFTDIWVILGPLIVFIWSIFSGFGITYQEKSGNPAGKRPPRNKSYLHILQPCV
jgi:hypothetical protein